MFYLKEFFKVLKTNLLLGVIFLVSTFGIITISHHQKTINRELSLSNKSASLPYFNALVSNESKMESIIRRMKQLPGVVAIREGQQSQMKSEISKLKSTFGESIIKGLATINYKRLKIELEVGLREKSQNLIKEYLTRLVGIESITLGEIRLPKEIKLKTKDNLLVFLNSIDVYIFSVLIGLWLVSSILLLNSVNTSSFIIEKFQRKTNTNIKIFMSGFLLLVFIALGLNYFSNNTIEFDSIIVALIMLSAGAGLTIVLKKQLKFGYGNS